MPYMYTEPNKVTERNGIAIYNVYKDGEYERPLLYWYTTDVCENEKAAFDIRALPGFKESGIGLNGCDPASNGEDAITALLDKSIDDGVIVRFDEDDESTHPDEYGSFVKK
jgi:hypothetical protein